MELCLGGVQFGLPYGVFSQRQIDPLMVDDILVCAKAEGVSLIDTSCAYGNSEEVLGASPHAQPFGIITKTPTYGKKKLDHKDAQFLRNKFLQSLLYFKRNSLHALLVHSANDLLVPGAEYLVDEMLRLKQEGRVKKIGVSVYAPEEVEKIQKKFSLDIVQLPLNIFDQRFLRNGMLKALAKEGIETHVRSVFLQGVLLRSSAELPNYFRPFLDHYKKYDAYCQVNQLTRVEACLNFVSSIDEVSVIISGVYTSMQLQDIVKALKLPKVDPKVVSHLENGLSALIDPRGWKNE